MFNKIIPQCHGCEHYDEAKAHKRNAMYCEFACDEMAKHDMIVIWLSCIKRNIENAKEKAIHKKTT